MLKINRQSIIHSSLFFALLLFSYACVNSSLKSIPDEAIIVCGDSKVLMVNYPENNDSVPIIVWSWDAQLANDLPFEYRTRRFNSIDDCKPTPDGKQVMVSSSSGAITIVSIKDKKVTFLADVPNAHSIEMLPGNKIVAAASTAANGNKIMLFENTLPEKPLDTDSLYSAHGVVWDNQRNVLYALGYDVLREYEISDKDKLVMTNEWTIPGISGHDLLMAPGGDKLFMTEHTGAWIFDIETHRFEKIDHFPDAEHIKSDNQHPSGLYEFTVAEESWWTYRVKILNPSGSSELLSFPNLKVYKARLYSN